METFIQTWSGKRVSLLDPRPEDITIEDIAWALAHQCRFGGHCKQFYSVAEHSMLVADILPVNLKFEGLLHDAAEAYVIDIPSPLKAMLPNYKRIEFVFEDAIRTAFGMGNLSLELKRIIKQADIIALATEARDLMRNTEDWEILQHVEPRDGSVLAMPSFNAYTMFIEMFTELKPNA